MEKDLWENQKEHEKARLCHLELEESIRLSSYVAEYILEDLNLKIGKKPNLLHDKFDGPNLYSIIGLLAPKITEIPETFNSKIYSKKDQYKLI